MLALVLVGGVRHASAQPVDPTPPADPAPPADPPPPADPTPPADPMPAEPAPDPNYADVDADAPDPLTTDTWRATRPFELHWEVLYLPQRVLELVFSPFEMLVRATEKHRLDRRVAALLSLDDGRYVIRPRVKFAFTDGPGLGATLTRKKLFDQKAELSFGGIYRTSNRDWQVDLEYEHALLLPGGRGLRADATAELDQNRPFYGIGPDSSIEDKRVLTARDQSVEAEIDIQGIDRYTYSGILEVALRRQTLEPGVSPTTMPVGSDGDTVGPPPGFLETSLYGDLGVVGRIDTRDTEARPTRGWLISLGALARAELTGADRSAVTIKGNARVHLPIIAELRTLMFAIGGTATLPLFPGDLIPLDSLAVLGRHNVRGYDRARFYGRYEVHATVEYRFPIYEYLASKVGIDATLFIDSGLIATDSRPQVIKDLRYSAGVGLRGAHETRTLFEMFFAWSPEGIQLVFGAEKQL